MKRTYIDKLREHVGEEVLISGWVDVRRDQGKLVFFDFRDMTGKVQGVVLPASPAMGVAKGIAIWKADENKTHLRVFTHSGISARYAHYFDTHPYPIDKKQRAILVRAFLERNLEFTGRARDKSKVNRKNRRNRISNGGRKR